ncbi:WxL domain-containing protein [Enterococcus sp. OL5]|uniref:WxL domain-containing protein n=1 Tax=Enterococcus sp. OL5 TaxID=2590214 RepID=UPI00112C6468|nr:WxL domain-containing protein [Enterococcus sp. OL5]TPR55089.1 WxL domain-containing protein [Enterococcus sp. OL5]
MKLIRLATIAALSSTILAGGAVSVFADETREVTTEGQVQFTPATDEDGEPEVIPPIDPEEGPDVEIDPEVPGTTGPLSIMKAATMNFGSQVISNQDQVYNMVAEMQQLRGTEGDENKVPYVSFAQVQDLRGTNAGWDLQVSLSDFTSNTQNNILTGAEITLVDSYMEYVGSNQENAPVTHEAGLKLLPNGAARSVMTAAQTKGAGASSVVWGDQADLDAKFADDTIKVVENELIKLSVPGSTAKDATTYTSTLTWELTSTPGDDA